MYVLAKIRQITCTLSTYINYKSIFLLDILLVTGITILCSLVNHLLLLKGPVTSTVNCTLRLLV